MGVGLPTLLDAVFCLCKTQNGFGSLLGYPLEDSLKKVLISDTHPNKRREESERTKWALVMSEFAPICIYLVIRKLNFPFLN